jgi:hypothetical protein
LYHKNHYYFEQAFANTDILVQEKILSMIDTESEKRERAADASKEEAYAFLE